MNDWFKLALPAVGVALTSITGYFFSTVAEDLKVRPTLVIAGPSGGAEAAWTFTNVSRVAIRGASFTLTCRPRPCFEAYEGAPTNATATPPRTYYKTANRDVISPSVVTDTNRESLVRVRLSLVPRDSVSLLVRPKPGAADTLELFYNPPPPAPPARREAELPHAALERAAGYARVVVLAEPAAPAAAPEAPELQIVTAGTVTALIMTRYLEVLAWLVVFSVALVALGILLVLLGGLQSLHAVIFPPKPPPPRPAAHDVTLRLAPVPPSRRPALPFLALAALLLRRPPR